LETDALPIELPGYWKKGLTKSPGEGGAADWNRTSDTWLFRPVLYLLSYGGEMRFVDVAGLEPAEAYLCAGDLQSLELSSAQHIHETYSIKI
jgi:hypothetical protein